MPNIALYFNIFCVVTIILGNFNARVRNTPGNENTFFIKSREESKVNFILINTCIYFLNQYRFFTLYKKNMYTCAHSISKLYLRQKSSLHYCVYWYLKDVSNGAKKYRLLFVDNGLTTFSTMELAYVYSRMKITYFRIKAWPAFSFPS